MRTSLGKTIARLKSLAQRAGDANYGAESFVPNSHLIEVSDFGSNPGKLKGWHFAPSPSSGAPLVVVLHGCTQSAAGYDHGSGWSQLAMQHGFALLYPEQQRSNNPNLCFNWFHPADTRRNGGEALSIRQMINAMIDRYALDPERVYITGLSAGGAMTSAMLAVYPEIFAGGAIIAGLPHGAASTIPEALERMGGRGLADDETYARAVREASQHRGAWPTISVWHGGGDHVVAPSNADAIVGQWRLIHGVDAAPDRDETIDGNRRRTWLDSKGASVIEEYRIAGMGHGTPLKVDGPDGCGAAVPHMLDVGISSTRHLAERWGLIDIKSKPLALPPRTRPHHSDGPWARAPQAEPRRPSSIQATIEAALKSAGLMR